MLRQVLYLPVPVGFKRCTSAPSSLLQKRAARALTSQDMTVGRNKNDLYIYLEYAYNLVYERREYRAHYTRFSTCPSQLADPER